MKYRTEYPRPQLVREKWQNLNGTWQFAFDDTQVGLNEKWFLADKVFDKNIEVPFAYQAKNSGIGDTTQHDTVWYKKEINVVKVTGQRYLLHFGAVDYYSDIYVNGQHVFYHEGGHTSFSVDITDYLSGNHDVLTVRAYDPQFDESIPRGKQIWEEKSKGIWYTNTTGIWQTVWIEEVASTYLAKLKMTPLFDEGAVKFDFELNNFTQKTTVFYEIFYKDELVCTGNADFVERKLKLTVDLLDESIFKSSYHGGGWLWSPEEPNLFDVKLTLAVADTTLDEVSSYFGLRKIHQENGMVYLNNSPYYQKLVLDQGYWPDGLLTAPTDEDFIRDIKLSKEMGFNGCRKHQKTEDPRFLYWADQLGYLVWGECASAPIYNNDAVNRLMHEWSEIVERDYNHPCIVTWVPLNESWGVPDIQRDRVQQHFSQTMFHYLHSLDSTRLVISNDGWSLTETDICAIHNYSHGNPDEVEKFAFFKESLSTKENVMKYPPSRWDIYAHGFSNQGEPILLTEFGGVGFKVDGTVGWGYTSVDNAKDFSSEYSRIVKAVYASQILYGFCYTQLTDVEQEINGLLSYDRTPKCPLSEIKAANDSYHQARI